MREHIREGRRKDGGSCELPGWLVEWLREGGREERDARGVIIHIKASSHRGTEAQKDRGTDTETLMCQDTEVQRHHGTWTLRHKDTNSSLHQGT